LFEAIRNGWCPAVRLTSRCWEGYIGIRSSVASGLLDAAGECDIVDVDLMEEIGKAGRGRKRCRPTILVKSTIIDRYSSKRTVIE
jgi:hypothetical protein